MIAQAATIAHLTAEVERLTRENQVLAAQAVIDTGRLRRLLALMPVVPASRLTFNEADAKSAPII